MSEESTAVENSNETGVASEASVATAQEPAKEAAPAQSEQEQSLIQSAEGEKAEEAKTPEATEKPESEKPESEKADDGKEEVKEGAPEKYEAFKAPEGTAIDEQSMDAFSEVAKELNLTQAQAQSIVDKVLPTIAAAQSKRVSEVSKQWADKSRADKEIGGANFRSAMADVARMRDRFARDNDGQIDPDIAEFIASPMGNHPGVLKLLARAGRAIGEAGFPTGGVSRNRQLTPDDIYGNHKY